MKKQLSGFQTPDKSIKIIKNNEIDLIALAKVIWLGRKKIYISIFVCLFIGILFALLSPVTYHSSAVLLPQAETKSDLGQLGSLASLAGVNLSSVMGDATGIQPDLYPNIVGSYPFLNELIHMQLNYINEDKPISFFDKELSDSVPGLGSIIMKYTLGLPWTLKNALFENKTSLAINQQVALNEDLIILDHREVQIFKKFHKLISVDVDSKTGLVSLSVEALEPYVTAQLANKTVELLQDYIIRYKTSQVRENLTFIEARFKEKKIEFEKAQQELFEYRDSYRNLVAERMDLRSQELEDEYNLSMSVYQNLAQQLEQARIAVKKETPAFTVIEPIKVPIEKFKPKRTIIVMVAAFIGGILGVLFLFLRLLIKKFRQAWNV